MLGVIGLIFGVMVCCIASYLINIRYIIASKIYEFWGEYKEEMFLVVKRKYKYIVVFVTIITFVLLILDESTGISI